MNGLNTARDLYDQAKSLPIVGDVVQGLEDRARERIESKVDELREKAVNYANRQVSGLLQHGAGKQLMRRVGNVANRVNGLMQTAEQALDQKYEQPLTDAPEKKTRGPLKFQSLNQVRMMQQQQALRNGAKPVEQKQNNGCLPPEPPRDGLPPQTLSPECQKQQEQGGNNNENNNNGNEGNQQQPMPDVAPPRS